MINQDKITQLFKDDSDSQNRRRSLLITTFIVCSVTVLFTILGFTTELPLPAEEGQFVLIGLEPDGEVMDNPQPVETPVEEVVEETEPVEEVVEPEVEPTQEIAENNLQTSDDVEAPEINASETPEEVTPEPEVVEPQEPDPVEPQRSTEADALAKLLQDAQQKPKGDPEGNNREFGESVVKFKAEMSFGSVGVVSGSGRGWVNMPDVKDDNQEKGDVFIKVTVDRDGNVVEARNDVGKSTTPSTILIEKAIASAKASKFEKAPNGPELTEEILQFSYTLK